MVKSGNHLTPQKRIVNRVKNIQTNYDPEAISRDANHKLATIKPGTALNNDAVFIKAMTLNEFQNGALLTSIVPEIYRTFAVDMLRKIQDEYKCKTVSERATAEIVTISFIRMLVIQDRINSYLSEGKTTELGVKFMAVMSKELDRANRHYTIALQSLRMLNQPSINVNVRSNTTIVGQHQVIQENQNVNHV